MKHFWAILTLLIISLAMAIVFAVRWWNINTQSLSSDTILQGFVIPRGKSASEIGTKLYNQNLIKSPLAFKIYVQVFGKADKINAGEFRLSPSMSLFEIVDRLGKGPVELWVTIPEGLRREEAVEKVIEALDLEPDRAIVFRQEFLSESKNMEGYLFPDTYLFPSEVAAPKVVARLRQTFEQKIAPLGDNVAASGRTSGELVTLASIIERETKADEERPIVAGILLKRLKVGQLLQTDASVQYAVGTESCTGKIDCEWWPILTKDDLEINSPYNLYKFSGFPPAPIASPGLSSIEAVVSPQDSPYWFYIHDVNGQIHYAETLGQHNQNVRKYLRK